MHILIDLLHRSAHAHRAAAVHYAAIAAGARANGSAASDVAALDSVAARHNGLADELERAATLTAVHCATSPAYVAGRHG